MLAGSAKKKGDYRISLELFEQFHGIQEQIITLNLPGMSQVCRYSTKQKFIENEELPAHKLFILRYH